MTTKVASGRAEYAADKAAWYAEAAETAWYAGWAAGWAADCAREVANDC